MFTLKNKQELNRNIPFSKSQFDNGRKSYGPMEVESLLFDTVALTNSVEYLDFEALMLLMQVCKRFREDWSRNC